MTQKTAIIIPARYASTRFPGKPLAKIAGKTMLSRVVELGKRALENHPEATLAVATEDERIEAHCKELDVTCYMTSDDCPTGSDRILEATRQMKEEPEIVIGLQGDTPYTPTDAIDQLINVFKTNPEAQVTTPVIQLKWTDLDMLRQHKLVTPFSGTTAIVNDQTSRAVWFSKNILPAIRGEKLLRQQGDLSPVHEHVGLYGYRLETLKQFVSLPQGNYEQLEGLEQLRLIENDIPIDIIKLDSNLGLTQAGVDTPEDIAFVETLLKDAA